MTQDLTMMKAALDYAARGWPVFPCDPDSKRPLVKGGLHSASVQDFIIRNWWARWPDAMIGVPTGAPIGAFVIDFDPADSDDGWATEKERLEATIEATEAGLSLDAGVVTPRGGVHLYFALPQGESIGNRANLLKAKKNEGKIDVRGDGGYVIVPPSRRPDGRQYEWLAPDRFSPGDAPPQHPAGLIDLITRKLDIPDHDVNIDDMTIGDFKKLAAMFNGNGQPEKIDNGMIGKYVIVRCRDAGVHAGELVSYNGRECVLKNSRRLWWWKAAKGAFLSGVATEGLSSDSKVGAPITVHLTENCEIIECTDKAEKSIREAKTYEP